MKNNNDKIRIRDVFKYMGAKSTIASILVFVLTVSITCIGGYLLYQSTKENIHLQGKLNVITQSY